MLKLLSSSAISLVSNATGTSFPPSLASPQRSFAKSSSLRRAYPAIKIQARRASLEVTVISRPCATSPICGDPLPSAVPSSGLNTTSRWKQVKTSWISSPSMDAHYPCLSASTKTLQGQPRMDSANRRHSIQSTECPRSADSASISSWSKAVPSSWPTTSPSVHQTPR